MNARMSACAMLVGVLLHAGAADAYKILMYMDDDETQMGLDSVAVVSGSCPEDLDWDDDDTEAPVQRTGCLPEFAYPPVFWDPSSSPIEVDVKMGSASDDFVAIQPQLNALSSACSAWDAVSDSLDVDYAGYDGGSIDLHDGVNVVAFGEWNDLGSDAGCTLLRVNDVAGDDYGEIVEVDIVLNDKDADFLWTTSTHQCLGPGKDTLDVQSVMTHELGHLLGLGHSEDTANCATMLGGGDCSSCFEDSLTMRTLSGDDEDGIEEIYGPAPDGYSVRSETGYPAESARKPVALGDADYAPALGAHPNPFNAETVVSFALDTAGIVTLSVTNALGQQVEQVVGPIQYAAGRHRITWNTAGRGLAGGMYFLHLTGPGVDAVTKVLLLQ